jgi:Protein of unknown function (DUF3098)
MAKQIRQPRRPAPTPAGNVQQTAPRRPSRSESSSKQPSIFSFRGDTLLFQKRHLMIMVIGLGLIGLGLLLMSGGQMTDPNTWDPSVIYSHRRITIAPILILTGLCMQIYAIFLRSEKLTTETIEETITEA